MKSIALSYPTWDLYLDSGNNIASIQEPKAMAQDVACACRLFLGELWYNTGKGVPYFDEILGKWPPMALVRSRLTAAAMTVPGVVSVKVVVKSLEGRELKGEVRFTDAVGNTNQVNL